MEKGDKEKGESMEIGNPLYCSYEDGQYVYKDPESKNQFVWVESDRKWVPQTALGGTSQVSFDADSNSYTYTDPEGTVFQWDPLKSAWFPKGTEQPEVDLSTTPSDNSLNYESRSGPSTPPPSSGFHNPNYDSSLQNPSDETPSSDSRNTRRFYYAALSPTDMGVNDPVLFLSPDDQVNNNSTIPQDSEGPGGVLNSLARGESVGQFPSNEGLASSAEASAASPALPCGWERHEDANGPYYWHIKSGTIQRDPPTHQQISGNGSSTNPALLIPGSLQSSSVSSVPFRRSQTVSSQLSSVVQQNNSNNSVSGSGDNTSAATTTVEKRKSWSQYLENSSSSENNSSLNSSSSLLSNQNGSKHMRDKPLRFVAVSLGCLCISEEDLTPERSSRAVSKVIAELTNPNSKLGSSAGIEVAGRIWGGGNELYLELDDSHLKVRVKEKCLTVLEQPIHSIRVWGVGREDPRDFAFVAREKQTRQFLCHVFRLEMYARPLANSLRDACKKIMIERQAKQKRPTSLPTGLRKPVTSSNTVGSAFFPTPMDEPRKVLKAYYLGSKVVNKPTGMDTLNAAIDALGGKEHVPVQVSVAPSVIKITSDETSTTDIDVEVRVRFLSFLGIGADVKTCGIIVHTARDDFEAHCFYSNPSTGALCKAIEAACVLRYQKCLDAHHAPPGGSQTGSTSKSGASATSPKTTAANLACAIKTLDEEFLARYHINYGSIPLVESSASTAPPPSAVSEESAEEEGGKKRKLEPQPPQWFDIDDTQNTNVYVSNLPTNISEDDFVQFMSKCGLVMKDPVTGKYKVKLYELNGCLKGDALCTYIKIDSVDLALQILDGAYFNDKQVKVERAKFTLKGQYDPTKKPKQRKKKDKEKLKKKQEALFAWKPEKLRGERPKHEKIVVIKNAFSPEDFNAQVELILELKEDFREEASKFGTCRRVEIFDAHPEGVAQIFMSSPEEADAMVATCNGRFFGGKRLTAELHDGVTSYKITETEAEKEKRLKMWEKYISDDGSDTAKDKAALATTPPRADVDSD